MGWNSFQSQTHVFFSQTAECVCVPSALASTTELLDTHSNWTVWGQIICPGYKRGVLLFIWPLLNLYETVGAWKKYAPSDMIWTHYAWGHPEFCVWLGCRANPIRGSHISNGKQLWLELWLNLEFTDNIKVVFAFKIGNDSKFNWAALLLFLIICKQKFTVQNLLETWRQTQKKNIIPCKVCIVWKYVVTNSSRKPC